MNGAVHIHSSVRCAKGTFFPDGTATLHGLQQRADMNGRVALVENATYRARATLRAGVLILAARELSFSRSESKDVIQRR
jgi:hypothetical protein